ncbi:MAG: alpha/beta hydrolase [Anaerolineae bacterium]|nr:alpha/beta hydrolase [Anaerolineae bacterium]
MSVIVLKSGFVHYEVLGRGRPVIFLHGWVGSWRYWMPALQAASTTYRAYALDLWGFGETTKNPEQYSLGEQVELVNGFLNEMGMGRVVLVGHGLGAVVSLLFSMRFPEVVERVMAISCPLEEKAISNRFRTGAPAALAEWLLPGSSPLAESIRLDAAKADPAALQVSMNDSAALTIQRLWEQPELACLWVHGQNDPAIAALSSQRFAEMPEHIHAILFEGSGHFPMLDENNKFNRLLIDFLNLPSGESPRQLQLKEEWRRRVR